MNDHIVLTTTSFSWSVLSTEVKQFMRNGWKPQGAPFVYEDNFGDLTYAQAMVR